MAEVRTIARGLYFGEGPRWHEGRLWFSDFYDHAVKSMGPDGAVTIEHQLDDQPSGLGWLPDGRLLVVSMRELKVLRQEGDGLVEHADLSGLARHLCNDMVVDGSGRAWVGNFGFDLDAQMEQKGVEGLLAEHPTTNLVRVDPDGSVHLAAADMHFPNGSAITPDGATLIVATFLKRHPESRVALEVHNTSTIIQRVARHELDLGLIEGTCRHPDLELEPWVGDELVVFCAPTHPLAARGRASVNELLREAWILRETGSGTREIFERAFRHHHERLEIKLELEHTEAI